MFEAPLLTKEKIKELQDIIIKKLSPMIDNDYVLLDLPYYDNLGDILIWEGTTEFLSGIKHKCRYSSGKDTYLKARVKRNNVILLQGGGNFGDLWPSHQEFRRRVIEDFPNQKIIILPQSVCYNEKANLRKDIDFFSRHPNVTICVRDNASKQILEGAFNNPILLIPDMAFFLNVDKWRAQNPAHKSKRLLLALRNDKELPSAMDLSQVTSTAVRHDWPSLENYPSELYTPMNRMLGMAYRLKKVTGIDLRRRIIDLYYQSRVKKHHLRQAVEFVDAYEEIWSTRLHITLLGMLLGKRIHILDNSYNKTFNLLDTWF